MGIFSKHLTTLSLSFAAWVCLQHTVSAGDLREELHQLSKRGHAPIGYNQTDEAMARIYGDPNYHGNILLFYTGRSQDVNKWVSTDSQDGWNREHLWPQSRGVRPFPMKSDLHNLMPTDASVNQRRGNLNFDLGGSAEGEAADTFLNGDSFEPRDSVKGDVARALFYMDVRYEGSDGEPDLKLVDDMPETGGVTIGDLCTLLNWHLEDQVEQADVMRNDLIEGTQGNRNPFIDQPARALALYGPECGIQPPTGDGDEPSTENQLRIGTWNIANLHHESGVPLRDRAVARDDIDYERLADLAASLKLDIVALQEIGSPRAVRRVFPESDYHLVMSDRYRDGDEERPIQQRDIFTGMVFSKQRFPSPPPVSTFSALSIDHVGFNHHGNAIVRPTRSSMVAEFVIADEPVKIMGVHLKSSCHQWSLDPVVDQSPRSGSAYKSRFDCRTLAAQRSVLESWAEQQASLGITTIVLGDFNRRFNMTDDTGAEVDDFWLDLNDGTPYSLALKKGPIGNDEICWPNHSQRYDEHIDFIVYDEALEDLSRVGDIAKVSLGFENNPRYAQRNRQRLSDHCPVMVTLEW